jgi:hypothetical protein
VRDQFWGRGVDDFECEARGGGGPGDGYGGWRETGGERGDLEGGGEGEGGEEKEEWKREGGRVKHRAMGFQDGVVYYVLLDRQLILSC